MVDSLKPVAIDASFIFERTLSRFLGANLLVQDGLDNTFAYGFLQAFLQLWQKLGRRPVFLLLTSGTFDTTDHHNIEYVSSILEALGVPVCSRPDENLLTVCVSILPSLAGIVSERDELLQFVREDFPVIRPRYGRDDLLFLDATMVRSEFGVDPSAIPTLLALTSGPRHARVTKRQAQRLIQTHGGLPRIYRDIPTRDKLAAKLKTIKEEMLERYRLYRATQKQAISDGMMTVAGRISSLDIPENVKILKDLRFHSLVRLLRGTTEESAVDEPCRCKSERTGPVQRESWPNTGCP